MKPSDMTNEQLTAQAKENWARSRDLQAEFCGRFDLYEAFYRNEARGNARVFGKAAQVTDDGAAMQAGQPARIATGKFKVVRDV